MGGERDLSLGFQGEKFERRFGCPGSINHHDPVESRKDQGVLDVKLETDFNGQVKSGLGSCLAFFLQAGHQGRPESVVPASGVAHAADECSNGYRLRRSKTTPRASVNSTSRGMAPRA